MHGPSSNARKAEKKERENNPKQVPFLLPVKIQIQQWNGRSFLIAC
jgi:hypothetical protein